MSFRSIIDNAKQEFHSRKIERLQAEALRSESDRIRMQEELGVMEAAAKARQEREALASNLRAARSERFEHNFGWLKKGLTKDENMPGLSPNRPIMGEVVSKERISVGGDPFGFKDPASRVPETVKNHGDFMFSRNNKRIFGNEK